MTTEDLLEIPDFLNRKLWSPERCQYAATNQWWAENSQAA